MKISEKKLIKIGLFTALATGIIPTVMSVWFWIFIYGKMQLTGNAHTLVMNSGYLMTLQALLVFSLGYGIYKKSRLCSALILIVYVSRVFDGIAWSLASINKGEIFGLFGIIGILLVTFGLIAGLIGTVKHHRKQKELNQ